MEHQKLGYVHVVSVMYIKDAAVICRNSELLHMQREVWKGSNTMLSRAIYLIY